MFFLRDRFIKIRLIVSSVFLLLGSQAWALEGSLSIQAGAATAFQSNGKALPSSFGPTGYASLDFNLSPSFALGLGSGLTGLVDGQHLWVDGTHLLGRWSPWPGSDWSPYLSAGFGFRPLSKIIPDHAWWDGSYQGTAAIGVRHRVARGMDLDLTAFYDINSPQADPLNSVGVRVGLAFPFGGEAAAETAQKPAPTAVVEPREGATQEALVPGKKGKKQNWPPRISTAPQRMAPTRSMGFRHMTAGSPPGWMPKPPILRPPPLSGPWASALRKTRGVKLPVRPTPI